MDHVAPTSPTIAATGLSDGQDLTAAAKVEPRLDVRSWVRARLAGGKRCLRVDAENGYRHEVCRSDVRVQLYGYRRYRPGETRDIAAIMGARGLSAITVGEVAATHGMPAPTADDLSWLGQ